MKRLVGLGVVCALALAGVAVAKALDVTIHGNVGPGRTISVADASGNTVSHVDAGATELEVEDQSDEHDFHLTGPGNIDVATTVQGTGKSKFDLVLVDGTYSFFCDAHPLTMKGSFTVGSTSAPPPPPPPATPPPPPAVRPTVPVGATMVLVLGVSGKPTLRSSAGMVVKRLLPGSYKVSVRDRVSTRGVRLTGAGAARATTGAFVGTAVWSIKLRRGTLRVSAIPTAGAATTVTVG